MAGYPPYVFGVKMSKFRHPRRRGFSIWVHVFHLGLVTLIISTACMVFSYAVVMGVAKAVFG